MKTQPWERQPGESEPAFAAFTVYRDMAEKRSLREVGRQLGKSRALIERWSSKWNWQERVRAYDNDLQKQQHVQAIKNSKKMAERHIDIALQMQVKALQALKALQPEKLDGRTLIALIREAARLERANRVDMERLTAAGSEQEAGLNAGSLAEVIAAAWEKRRNNDND